MTDQPPGPTEGQPAEPATSAAPPTGGAPPTEGAAPPTEGAAPPTEGAAPPTETSAAPPTEGALGAPAARDASHPPRAAQGETPLYRGEPLDAERGPGLGCFWTQVILLGFLLVFTPITVALAWPSVVSAGLLILTLILLLFTGQTVIFLLRLVAADRRGRRTPRSAAARKTVGMLEDEAQVAAPSAEASDAGTDDPASSAP